MNIKSEKATQIAAQNGLSTAHALYLLPLFLLSGCAALIYEVVWYQSLALIVGSSTVSLAVILATYMGGMCLGSLEHLRWAERGWRPLYVYAALELTIGAFGLLVLFLLPWAGGLYTAIGSGGLDGALLRGLFCAIFLLVPTMAMGATLPTVARSMESTPYAVSWVGRLYATNILGGVAGCLLAGVYLLRIYDDATATYVAVALNVAVAVAAILLALYFPQASSVPATATRELKSMPRTGGAGLIYLAIGLSGATALGAEVVWTRLLTLLLGGTVYTFALILAAMLIGLGIGSLVGTALVRNPHNARGRFCAAQILVVASLAWAAWSLTQELPLWPIDPQLASTPWVQLQIDFVRCLWVVTPGAIFWGASFPLALASVSSAAAGSSRGVAKVYAANTLGAIAGALLASLVLIADFGTQNTQRILIAWAGAAALLLLLSAAKPRPARLSGILGRVGSGLAMLVVAALLGWSVAPVPPVLVGYGRFAATWLRSHGEFIYVGEGMNSSPAVSRTAAGALNYHNAGKVQASSEPQDMRVQRMLGHLTTLIPKSPKEVLVIGCGAGVTAGAVSIDPRVEHETIVEIERLVPYAVSTYFSDFNFNVIRNPKVETLIGDGRHFLMTTDRKFDAITMDPFDLWVKGAATLNTLEFFQEIKRHLNPGGVLTIWLQLYEMDTAAVKSELATFAKVFPSGALFGNTDNGEGYDTVLVGSAGDLQIDVDDMEGRLNTAPYTPVRRSLAENNFDSAESLLSTFAVQLDQLGDWLADGEINRDRNLRLQYLAGLALNKYQQADIYRQILSHRKRPEHLFTGDPERLNDLYSKASAP